MNIATDAPKRPALRYYGGKWNLAPSMYLRQAILERDAVPEAFRVEVINKRCFVMFRHTRLGEIAQDTDGEFVFFPKPQREGFWRSWLMKAIAAELDKLNSGDVTA